jgi:group II intron reverse transcriptase/maturase
MIFSYGFRPGKSAHQALQQLFEEVSFRGKRYLIDADMKNYFGSIEHQCLRSFLDERIKDGVIRKQIDKWLKAGVLESGMVKYPKAGTPQGGNISPLLSNIYLHYVLDEWFTEQIQPLLRGGSSLIRFADDFVLCFSSKIDAERVLRVLPKRLSKYGLALHPEKTRLVEVGKGKQGDKGTFDFLGFTHYLGRSRKGKSILKRKTSSKKLRMSLKKIYDWIKANRHDPIKDIIKALNRKLRGYYEYYGITFNRRSLQVFYNQVVRMLYKWLNRRGGKRKLIWERYSKLIKDWLPLLVPKIYHSYLRAKPYSEEPYA